MKKLCVTCVFCQRRMMYHYSKKRGNNNSRLFDRMNESWGSERCKLRKRPCSPSTNAHTNASRFVASLCAFAAMSVLGIFVHALCLFCVSTDCCSFLFHRSSSLASSSSLLGLFSGGGLASEEEPCLSTGGLLGLQTSLGGPIKTLLLAS